MAYSTYESEPMIVRPSSTKSSSKRSTRQLFNSFMKALAPQVETDFDTTYSKHASNRAAVLMALKQYIFFPIQKFTMAGISFEQLTRSSSSSSKGSKRHIFGSILRHLAPQVEVDPDFKASSANHASVIMARAH
ncbi:uncharacterized protein SAPINGB_P005805 [Magnusiomyces paraingens]|uniref:Uncharacterized protein n=1 Tax=Magnusiomyces paraingens TaxID=2606893 RepID=A0A5E8C6Z1_9ASCO|nr:uncharacterized protein SAPINGB_P005805 [Saprochaete ingens]VVT57658.1 unnamed protein product [Saprochaete ingens]